MPESVLALAVALGVVCALLQAIAQRALITAPAPPPPGRFPPISILKPLKGVDAGLEENLRSLYRLDYPEFEVILGTEDADDPALGVARRLAAEFPAIRSVIASEAATIGFNPKVNNLANLADRARYPLLLISDSNIRVTSDYLRDLVAHRARAGGGLVWSLVRGVHGRGLGGILESLQLNGPIMGGASALSQLKIPCAVGKSMLLHRADLERIGGFRFLGQFLAEDQICAEEFVRRGRPVAVTGRLIDNVLGPRTFRDFAGRHLRWARLRRQVSPAGYLGEFVVNPVFVALVGVAVFRSFGALLVAGLALACMSLINASTERLLEVRRPAWVYPPLELLLSVVRGALWFVPLVSRTVVWRGTALPLAARSRIELNGHETATEPSPPGVAPSPVAQLASVLSSSFSLGQR